MLPKRGREMLLVTLRGALALAGACGFMAAAAGTAMLTGSLAFLAAFALLALTALVGTGALRQARGLLTRADASFGPLIVGLAAALGSGNAGADIEALQARLRARGIPLTPAELPGK